MARERYPIRIDEDARFMRAVAWALLVLTVIGFVPTYFVPLSDGSFLSDLLWMHPHAIAGFAFAAFFIAQPTMVLKRNWKLHRTMGLIVGITVIASAITGVAVQFEAFPRGPETAEKVISDSFRTFQLVPLMLGFFVAGVMMRRRPDWHWRLMYLAAITPFGTVVGRYVRAADQMFPTEGIAGPVLTFINLLIFIALIVYDLVRYRRVHRASWIGLVAFLATTALSLSIGFSDWWQGIALAG